MLQRLATRSLKAINKFIQLLDDRNNWPRPNPWRPFEAVLEQTDVSAGTQRFPRRILADNLELVYVVREFDKANPEGGYDF